MCGWTSARRLVYSRDYFLKAGTNEDSKLRTYVLHFPARCTKTTHLPKGAFDPSNIWGHIRSDTDCLQCVFMMTTYRCPTARSACWNHNPISHSAWVSWYWENQSLPNYSNMERIRLICYWFDSVQNRNSDLEGSVLTDSATHPFTKLLNWVRYDSSYT